MNKVVSYKLDSTKKEDILNTDDVLFIRRKDAEEVLDQMRDLIKLYGFATVADFVDLSSVTTSYRDSRYAWSNLDDASIQTRDVVGNIFYMISFPEPKLIDSVKQNVSSLEDKMVSHPDHYMSETGLETIDVIEAFTFDLKGIEATDTGNIIKYICRWKHKNGLQDLQKAKWYLDHLINHVKKLEEENM